MIVSEAGDPQEIISVFLEGQLDRVSRCYVVIDDQAARAVAVEVDAYQQTTNA